MKQLGNHLHGGQDTGKVDVILKTKYYKTYIFHLIQSHERSIVLKLNKPMLNEKLAPKEKNGLKRTQDAKRVTKEKETKANE